jgi:transcriptional regulator with XRE-family HTH domain
MTAHGDDATLRQRVGARIRAARNAEGLSQEQVAQRVGMTRSSIANLEAGRQDMNISRLALVAAAVNLNLADLIRPEDLPELPPPPPRPHDVTIRQVWEVECRTCQAVIDAPDSYGKALATKRDHIAEQRAQAT